MYAKSPVAQTIQGRTRKLLVGDFVLTSDRSIVA